MIFLHKASLFTPNLHQDLESMAQFFSWRIPKPNPPSCFGLTTTFHLMRCIFFCHQNFQEENAYGCNLIYQKQELKSWTTAKYTGKLERVDLIKGILPPNDKNSPSHEDNFLSNLSKTMSQMAYDLGLAQIDNPK